MAQQASVQELLAKANAGDATAQNELGYLYLVGEGVEKNPTEAFRWHRSASRQGYPPALYNVAAAYYNGDGTKIDDVRSYA